MQNFPHSHDKLLKIETIIGGIIEMLKRENEIVHKLTQPKKNRKMIAKMPLTNHLMYIIRTNRRVKQALIALSSSLLIGITFGLIFLSMVKQEEPAMANTLHMTTTDDEENTTDVNTYAIESFYFYVVQAGVFSEEENAQALVDELHALSYPAYIWERENQYFVLAGIEQTEERAGTLTDKMKEDGIDVFVKQWDMEVKASQFSEEDIVFLQNFLDLWNETVHPEADFKMNEWIELTEMSITEEVAGIQNVILSKVANITNQNKEMILLEFMNEYDHLPSQK